MRNRILLIFTCLCSLAGKSLAQGTVVRGMVSNQFSKENIVFASIAWKQGGKGCVTDSSGHFSLQREAGNDTLIISHVGFTPVMIPIDPGDTAMLSIELVPRESTEVVVKAKYNRGLFWWKKIVQYKLRNNPYSRGSWSCSLYKKLELDLDNVTHQGFERVKLLKPFSFIANNIDSTDGGKPFLPVYLTESVSRYYVSAQPFKKREIQEAIQTNGITNEEVLHVIEALDQRINVYDNYITVFGKSFISPLSSAGSTWYNYQAADTQYINGRQYLHLLFTPRHDGENSFSGDCWVQRDTWGIYAISMEISSTANINFVKRLTLRQEFSQQPDSSWICTKDQFIAEISPLKKNKLSLVARQTTFYRQVKFNQAGDFPIMEKNVAAMQPLNSEEAGKGSAAYWEQVRAEPLSVNEQRIYKMVDTLQSIPLFKTYTTILECITDGRKQLGKIEIGPWYKWMSSNEHEKLRLRFDIATSEAFSKLLRLHGYLAYGTGDEAFKGQLDMRYRLPGNKGYTVQASWVHDLDNGKPGEKEEGLTTDNLFSQFIRRAGVRQKFIMVDEARTGIAREWANHFSAGITIRHTHYITYHPLLPIKMISVNEKNIINTELGFKLRYAPGEKRIVTYRRERSIPGNKPALELQYAMGVPGIIGSQYSYRKLHLLVTQQANLPGIGKIDCQLFSGKTWGEPLPFMLLDIHPGNETYYYSGQSFNLMSRYEYVSDRYAGFMIEHNFEKKLLNLLPFLRDGLRRVNIRQFWTLKGVWGDLSAEDKKLNCKEYRNYRMKSLMGKPYIELGTGLDNILNYFRVDLVWRFAPAQPVYRAGVSITQSNYASAFGIFGSFHIQF